MNIEDIKETPIWQLYDKGRNYLRLINTYVEDTDRNYRFYNGNQWEGAKLGDVEPVQKNFIKPIVKYKISVIHDNLYAINYSSQNYEMPSFRKTAERYCEMLNGYAARIWERDKMDFKGRKITKDAAINDEGIIYVNFDKEKMLPVNEVVKKIDIYYGNENDDDIQAQPYILIRKRMPVINAIEFALNEGMSESKKDMIISDSDTFEESGEAAKYEVDDGVTIVYKMYKKDGTVHYSIATRYVDIVEDVDTGLSIYPIAHFNWEEKEGSARGEGEVRYLIPNQIEVNKTEMRRVLTVKSQAYPKMIAAVNRITNPDALDTVGGVIKTTDQTVDDVHKIVSTLQPAQMSSDVKELQESLIQTTRELAGAGDTATGQVNPEDASGRAILAVQQALRAPITEQKESYKNFIEDLGRIWLEYLIVYSVDGIDLEEVGTLLKEKMLQGDIPDEVWAELQEQINAKLAELGIDPIEIDVKTGNVKQAEKDAGDMAKNWQKAAYAVGAVGNAMSQIEDPAAKVMGTLAQAVATVALGYAQATKQASSMGPWAWIAFAATGLATMITTISTIKSTAKFSEGGVIHGNSYSGDNIGGLVDGSQLVGLNSGEVVLNHAQQNNLANELEGNRGEMQSSPYVMGEQIFLGVNTFLRRSGRGELVTTKG